MQSDNEFDNRFKQIFHDAEATPSADLFEKIEAEISGKKKNIFAWMAVAASIAAIIAVGLFWKLQMSKIDSNVVVINQQKNIPQQDSVIAPANKIAIVKDVAPQKKENAVPKKIVHHIKQKHEEQIKNTVASVNTKKEEPQPNTVAAIDSAIQPKKIVIDNNTNNIALNTPLTNHKNQTGNTQKIESSIAKKNSGNTVAINQPQQATGKKRKGSFFSKMFTSIKNKAKDVSETVYNEDENSTTINMGFMSVTKYKNQ